MLKEIDQISQTDSGNESSIREKIYLLKDERVIRYGYNKTSIYVGRRKKSYDVRQFQLIHPLKKFQRLIDKVEEENEVQPPEVDHRLQDLRDKINNLLKLNSSNNILLTKKITCLLYLTDEMEKTENVDVQISIKGFNQRLPEQYHIAFSELLVDIQRLFPNKEYIVRENILEVTISNLETLEYYYEKSLSEEKRVDQDSEQLIKKDVKSCETKKEIDYDGKKNCWNCRNYIIIDSKSCCELDDHVIRDIDRDCCENFQSVYSKKPKSKKTSSEMKKKDLISGNGYCWDCKYNVVENDSFYCLLDGHEIKNLSKEGCSDYIQLGKYGFDKESSSDLEIGKTYSNNEIQEKLKCSSDGRIRRSRKNDCLILISNQTKSIYHDFLRNTLFHFTGIGLNGNQSITYAPHKNLIESNEKHTKVYLFVVFVEGRYTYFGQVILAGEAYTQTQNDENGKLRDVWMFPLKLEDDLALHILKKSFENHKDLDFEKQLYERKQDVSVERNIVEIKPVEEKISQKNILYLTANDIVEPSNEKYFVMVNGSRMINCKHQIVKHPNLNTQKMIDKISIGEVVSNNKIDEDRVRFNKDHRDSNVKIVEYNNQLFDVRDDGNIVRLIDRKTGVIKKMYRSNEVELRPKKSENILDVLEKEIGIVG
jgi:hypothetical protein